MVSIGVIASLVGSMVTGVLVLVLIFWIGRRRMTLSVRNILLGAGVFFLFSQVLERLLHQYLLISNPGTATWFRAHPLIFALYACGAAAVFEEVGRFVGLKALAKRDGAPGTGVAFGLGHGGTELLLLGSLASINLLILAGLLNSGQFDSSLGASMPVPQLEQLRAQVLGVTPELVTIGALERLAALMIQIGLSVLVWMAVERGKIGLWLAALGLHAVVDFPAGLFQAGLISLFPVEVVTLGTGAVLAVVFLLKLRQYPVRPMPTGSVARQAAP